MACQKIVLMGVALAIALSSVQAATLYFRADRCNTNIDDNNNWRGRYPVFTSARIQSGAKPVRKAHLGPSDEDEEWKPVNSHIRAANVRVNTLSFADTGIVSFASNGFRLELFDEAETEGEGEFVAGQEYIPECDINCADNWSRSPSGQGSISDDPVCEQDTGVIPEGYSVKLFAFNFVNVFSLRWGNTPDIFSAYDIPTYQIYPQPHQLLIDFSKSQDICAQKDLYNPTTLECVCASTCAGPQHLDQASDIREVAKLASNSDMTALTKVTRRRFSVIFSYAQILDDTFTFQEIDRAFDCLLENHVFDFSNITIDPIVAGILDHMRQNVPYITIFLDDIRFERTFRRVRVSGSVEAPFAFFHRQQADGSFLDTWETDTTVTDHIDSSKPFLRFFWDGILNQANDCHQTECTEATTEAQEECDDDHENFCSDLQILFALFPAESMADDIATVVDAIKALPTDARRRRRDAASTTTAEPTTESLVVSYNGVDLDLGDLVYRDDVDRSVLVELRFLMQMTFERVPMDAADKAQLETAIDAYVAEELSCTLFKLHRSRLTATQTMTVRYPGGFIGDRLPQSDVNRIADPMNSGFREYVAEKMSNIWPILFIDEQSISWQLQSPTEGRVRRGSHTSTGLAQILLWITFDYTMVVADDCAPDDTRLECPLSSESPLSEFLRLTLDDIISIYPIETETCYHMVNGVDADCVRSETKKHMEQCALDNLDILTRTWLVNECGVPYYEEQYGCGEFGSRPDGQCYDPSAETEAATMAAQVVPELANEIMNDLGKTTSTTPAPDETTEPPNESSSSASMVAIAGGAGGGIIVLAIVIVVIVFAMRNREKRDSEDTKDRPDRDVVAFENPMYDDPTKDDGMGAFMYADGGYADTAEDEGLYDEPALNAANSQAKKENPLYTSAEDLLAGVDEDADGDEGGYLDVAPDDAVYE